MDREALTETITHNAPGLHMYSGCAYVTFAKQTGRTKHSKHCCCAANRTHRQPPTIVAGVVSPSLAEPRHPKWHRPQNGLQASTLATTCMHTSRGALHENVRSPTGIDPGQDIPRRMENNHALNRGHDVTPRDFHRRRFFPRSFIAVNAVQVHLRLGRGGGNEPRRGFSGKQ